MKKKKKKKKEEDKYMRIVAGDKYTKICVTKYYKTKINGNK